MKVLLSLNQMAYRGKKGDLVYYWNPRYQCLIARKIAVQKGQSASSQRLGNVSANLRKLNPSEQYRAELRAYLILLHQEGYFPKLSSWYLLYTKVFYAFAVRHPEWDIATLSRAEILVGNLSCRTVKTAVEDCLLPMVRGYEAFTALL